MEDPFGKTMKICRNCINMIQYDSTCLKFSLKYLTGFDGFLSLKMVQFWWSCTDPHSSGFFGVVEGRGKLKRRGATEHPEFSSKNSRI